MTLQSYGTWSVSAKLIDISLSDYVEDASINDRSDTDNANTDTMNIHKRILQTPLLVVIWPTEVASEYYTMQLIEIIFLKKAGMGICNSWNIFDDEFKSVI